MRFAIKTAPQNDLGRDARHLVRRRRHRAVPVGLDVRPLLSHLRRLGGTVPGGLDHDTWHRLRWPARSWRRGRLDLSSRTPTGLSWARRA